MEKTVVSKAPLTHVIVQVDGERWFVESAVTAKDAEYAIALARTTGTSALTSTVLQPGNTERVMAKVCKVIEDRSGPFPEGV